MSDIIIKDGVKYRRRSSKEILQTVSLFDQYRLTKANEGVNFYQMTEEQFLAFRDAIPGTLEKLDV